MMRGNGSPKFNGIAVGEVGVNLLGPSIHLSTIFAFTNAETGERYGRAVKEGNWSEETMKRFLAFLESAETDICNDVFDAGGTPETVQTVVTDDEGIKSL